MDQNLRSTSEQIVASLRRITRSMDLHSRSLAQSHGLTGPQATVLYSLTSGAVTAGDLATRINLSQGTVTDILKRLESRNLVARERDADDKRRVIVTLTELGDEVIKKSLPLMQALFDERLREVPEWEQSQLLAALQRIAHMMEGGIAPRGDSGPKSVASRIGEADLELPADAA